MQAITRVESSPTRRKITIQELEIPGRRGRERREVARVLSHRPDHGARAEALNRHRVTSGREGTDAQIAIPVGRVERLRSIDEPAQTVR